jgi:PadR family transcriptional regulator
MRSDQTRGHLDDLLLATLEQEPAHGYLLIERLRERSGGAFDLPEGTVYPALHRLERAGQLESAWDDGGARRRRVYRITQQGRGTLAGRRREWTAFSAALSAAIGGHA